MPVKSSLNKSKPSLGWLWWLVAVVAVGALVAFGVLPQLAPASEATALPAEVSVNEASRLVDAGAFLLDVRTQAEWDEAHVPGATLIPLDQLSSRLDEIPTDQQVVVICRSGNRSAEGRDILKRAGFEQVTSVAGGINQWRAAGLPVE